MKQILIRIAFWVIVISLCFSSCSPRESTKTSTSSVNGKCRDFICVEISIAEPIVLNQPSDVTINIESSKNQPNLVVSLITSPGGKVEFSPERVWNFDAQADQDLTFTSSITFSAPGGWQVAAQVGFVQGGFIVEDFDRVIINEDGTAHLNPTPGPHPTSDVLQPATPDPQTLTATTVTEPTLPLLPTPEVIFYPPPSSDKEPTLGSITTAPTKPTLPHTPTLTVTIAPTVTISAYTGSPFSIVFNDGNLWLKEIGSELERQLTHETEGWFINQFAINHLGDQIAYIALKRDVHIVDGMIKLVDLRTGEVRPLFGMGDGLIENRVKWLDQTHLAFSYEDFGAYPMETPLPPPAPEVYHPYFYSVFDLTTGETKPVPQAVDISLSPDGRYLLTCTSSYHYEPDCEFRLHDLTTNHIDPIAEDTNFGWFRGWSYDSQWMLFENALYGEVTGQKFMIVNAHSLNSTWALGTGQACNSTAWAFQSALFACTVCEGEKGCEIRFYGPDGFQARPPISLPGQYYLVSWTPDDTRLLLYPEAHTLWVINADGTGLQQVFGNVVDWAVLPTGSSSSISQ